MLRRGHVIEELEGLLVLLFAARRDVICRQCISRPQAKSLGPSRRDTIPFYLGKFKFDDGGGRHNDVLDSRFDIIAKPPENVALGQAILMLRRLLAERFNLRVHTKIR